MNRNFKIIYKAVIILLAVLATFLMSSVILLVLRADIMKTFYTILISPLTKMGHITEVLIRAIPLCIIALGVSVAYRSGIINIGAEGQMAMGILAFTAVALACPDLPRPVLLPFALLMGALGGALWGFIPGILKAKLQVSELLSTVMLNYIAAQFYSFCLRVVMLDPAEKVNGSGTPQSMRLTANIELGRISGRLHYGIVIALVLAVLVYLLMWKTSFGYKMRASGAGSRAARYGGINVSSYLTVAMIISGAAAGLAGGIEIAGVHRRAIEGVTNNYGFSAVVVALFGGLHPIGIIPASFFFALIIYGSTLAPRAVNVPANIVQVMQGLIIIVIVTTQMIISNTYLEDRVYRKVRHLFEKEAE
ncbi:MAG: ABC transporter permease [Bullifex sp.]|nr:ABC transporter permease [Bullifex sp.]MDY5908686.1 ABC transporter permease [Bullifex sp.]